MDQSLKEARSQNLVGHAIPGSFLCFLSLWWSTKYILKYTCRKYKRTCHLGSQAIFYRIEILEGIILIGMTFGVMTWSQFHPGGLHLRLYDYKEGRWYHLLDWHHNTMYFFFGLLGVTKILCSISRSLPVSLPKLMMANAFFVEAFVFYNHIHGRDMLDIYIHQLLISIISVTGLLTFIDSVRNNIILELLQPSFVFFQGTWLWQIGFMLRSTVGDPVWDPTDHDNIMFITMCFCWHYAVSLTITGLNYIFVTWLVKSKLKRFCSLEVGLLKNTEQEQELEEEM